MSATILNVLQVIGMNFIPIAALDTFDFSAYEKVGVVAILLGSNALFWKVIQAKDKKNEALYKERIDEQAKVIRSMHDQLKRYRNED